MNCLSCDRKFEIGELIYSCSQCHDYEDDRQDFFCHGCAEHSYKDMTLFDCPQCGAEVSDPHGYLGDFSSLPEVSLWRKGFPNTMQSEMFTHD